MSALKALAETKRVSSSCHANQQRETVTPARDPSACSSLGMTRGMETGKILESALQKLDFDESTLADLLAPIDG